MSEYKISNSAERLKEIMESRNLKQVDILKLCEPYSKKFGIKLSKSALSQYINGIIEPQQNKLLVLSRALKVNPAWLMGLDVPMEYTYPNSNDFSKTANLIPFSSLDEVPIIGSIACGAPITAYDDDLGTVKRPPNVAADFALIAKGDSMIDANIFDGDVVFIRKQPTVDNGSIAAVRINGEATLKRIYVSSNNVILAAENKKYQPIVLNNFYDDDDITIIGKATHITTKLK